MRGVVEGAWGGRILSCPKYRGKRERRRRKRREGLWRIVTGQGQGQGFAFDCRNLKATGSGWGFKAGLQMEYGRDTMGVRRR